MRIAIMLMLAALAGLAACGGSQREPSASPPGDDARANARAEAVVPRYADEDRDGKVTRNEAGTDPALAASFDRYDTNRDGELDRGEFARLETGADKQRRPGDYAVP